MLVFRTIVGVICFPTALLLPAGRVDWLEGWAFLIVFFSAVVLLRVTVARRNPSLIKERLHHPSDAEKWDTILMGIYSCLLLGMFVVSALDSGRYGWSPRPETA